MRKEVHSVMRCTCLPVLCPGVEPAVGCSENIVLVYGVCMFIEQKIKQKKHKMSTASRKSKKDINGNKCFRNSMLPLSKDYKSN